MAITIIGLYMLMENLLWSKEYGVLIESGVPGMSAMPTPEQKKNVEESRLKDLKAKNYILQSIGRSIIETKDDKDSTIAIWESMKRKIQRKGFVNRWNESSKGKGRAGRGGRGRGRQLFNKDTIECYKCRNLGHYQYDCPRLEENANYAEFNEDEEVLLMAYSADVQTNSKDKV